MPLGAARRSGRYGFAAPMRVGAARCASAVGFQDRRIRPLCHASELTMWGFWTDRHLWTGALYGSPMNTRKSRLSPTGYVALAIIIVVLAYGLLYAARALMPAL